MSHEICVTDSTIDPASTDRLYRANLVSLLTAPI